MGRTREHTSGKGRSTTSQHGRTCRASCQGILANDRGLIFAITDPRLANE